MRTLQYSEMERRMGRQGLGGGGMGSDCLMGVEFQFTKMRKF